MDNSRPSTSNTVSGTNSASKMPSNDFVRKLYGILERCEYPDIVRWTEGGDSFVVLDTGKFTTQILPNHFKHSNFASFVRQLNKYDFHKVKKTPEEKQYSQYGELSWEFKHPFFSIHNEAALDNIKRKTTAQKKVLLGDSGVLLNSVDQSGLDDQSATNLLLANTVAKDKFNVLKRKVDKLQKDLDMAKQESYNAKLEFQKLNSKYNTMVESLLTFKTLNDNLLNNFGTLCTTLANRGVELPQTIYDYVNLNNTLNKSATAENVQVKSFELNNWNDSMVPGRAPMPSGTSNAAPTTNLSLPLNVDNGRKRGPNQKTNENSILREGFHVLLVEDDAVCIQLCSKFLRKYGCTVEVVTDGLSAITTLEKFRYDIVLMDIVMPNLDGATATSIVRSFDNHTPIIAMTGNIEDQDLITYLQHGMNDILAKPFTKDDLHSMLIRYLRDRIPLSKQHEQRPREEELPQSPSQSQTTPHSQSQPGPPLREQPSMQTISEDMSRPASSTVSESDVNGLIQDEPILKKQRV